MAETEKGHENGVKENWHTVVFKASTLQSGALGLIFLSSQKLNIYSFPF